MHGINCMLSNDVTFEWDPLNTLNSLHDFVSANVHGSRSKNNRMEHLYCRFLKHQPEIGPSCLTIKCSLQNGRKTNLFGRMHYAGNALRIR